MSSNTTNTHPSARSGADTVNALKSGAAGLHVCLSILLYPLLYLLTLYQKGIGETIRGNLNQAVDTAFNDKAGEAKNQAIANKGLNEIEDGKYRGHGTGVNTTGPIAGTTTGTTTGMTAGNTNTVGTTTGRNTGIGSTTAGTTTTPGLGSSNYGPHNTNLGNKIDPTVDSDLGMSFDHLLPHLSTFTPIILHIPPIFSVINISSYLSVLYIST